MSMTLLQGFRSRKYNICKCIFSLKKHVAFRCSKNMLSGKRVYAFLLLAKITCQENVHILKLIVCVCCWRQWASRPSPWYWICWMNIEYQTLNKLSWDFNWLSCILKYHPPRRKGNSQRIIFVGPWNFVHVH